ncbi:hypothetical protein [Catenulispora subtropica]|uniref:Uncharacterized protein n=1 Tax=Catenulispora subtropica TaxID=450798 RepID=A0ABN2S3R9_9ACTN
MRRCQHFCGCEGNAAGRDPETGLMLCAGCLGRSILGTDCSRARKYFGHMPARFGDGAWDDPPPLRDGDRSAGPAGFEVFLTIRTGFDAPAWDFMPLAEPAAVVAVAAAVGAGWARAGLAGLAGSAASAGLDSVTNPHRPPKDPPPGPLPPPPGRPVQPSPPRR